MRSTTDPRCSDVYNLQKAALRSESFFFENVLSAIFSPVKVTGGPPDRFIEFPNFTLFLGDAFLPSKGRVGFNFFPNNIGFPNKRWEGGKGL